MHVGSFPLLPIGERSAIVSHRIGRAELCRYQPNGRDSAKKNGMARIAVTATTADSTTAPVIACQHISQPPF